MSDESYGKDEPTAKLNVPGASGDKKKTLRERIGRGPVAFMAGNSVAANLLMLVFLIGGLVTAFSVKKEVMPEFNLNMVTVQILYPGASPAEVEQGAVLAIEEAVRGLDGVKNVRSNIEEGVANIAIELRLSANAEKLLGDIKSAVDRITSFPQDMERPVVSQVIYRNQVIALVIYGDQDEAVLRQFAERAREELLNDSRVSLVELAAVRDPEISIEVPQENLRRYNLTLDEIAARVRGASVEVPGGGVKTAAGEILLRTTERRTSGREFADITILSRPDGSRVRLGDVANVVDGFKDTDEATYFNGKRAVMVQVFRVGDETPTSVAGAVFDYIDKTKAILPPGVELATWKDASQMYRERLDLMLKNGKFGLILVLLTLALFLEIRLAIWVTMGIPISIAGAFLFLPSVDVSVNMISLFAFIVTLGIVVDDAIVVGEAAFERHRNGASWRRAAIEGAREVAQPVTFSVLTTLVAFAPMLFVPGTSGQFFRNVPLVVFTVLAVSLVESLFILPAHLAHMKQQPWALVRFISRYQGRVVDALQWFVDRTYRPTLRVATRVRYFTLAIGGFIFLATIGYVAGGRVGFTFMPKIDSDQVNALLTLPFGASAADTEATVKRIEQGAMAALRKLGADKSVRGVMMKVGGWEPEWRPPGELDPTGSHRGQVTVYLGPSDTRAFSAESFTELWRELTGEIAGVDTLSFNYSLGPGAQKPIEIELSHTDLARLEGAASVTAARLAEFAGTRDVDDGFQPGKEQLDFRVRPEAQSLGISEFELARQVRAAFYGAEATRQQRGRDELRVYVRLPREQRASEFHVGQLLLRTPGGGEIPLDQAATIERGRSHTKITRNNGRRVAFVSSDITEDSDANSIMGEMMGSVLPAIASEHPGLRFGYSGQQKEQQENMKSLGLGFLAAVFVMFALLAVGFRSYVQPAIVMSAIPFGFVGAVWGHVVMGYDLSLMSIMGITALAGVVVNDSIVLIHATNDFRRETRNAQEAAVLAGVRRFRPVLLTSLTTFAGLFPMVLETSMQARFLIPMAISLAFGVLFSTFVTLVLVPCLYLAIEDLRRFGYYLLGKQVVAPGAETSAQASERA